MPSYAEELTGGSSSPSFGSTGDYDALEGLESSLSEGAEGGGSGIDYGAGLEYAGKALGDIATALSMENSPLPPEIIIDEAAWAMQEEIMTNNHELRMGLMQAEARRASSAQQIAFHANGASGGSAWALQYDTAMLASAQALGMEFDNASDMNKFHAELRSLREQKRQREKQREDIRRADEERRQSGLFSAIGSLIFDAACVVAAPATGGASLALLPVAHGAGQVTGAAAARIF